MLKPFKIIAELYGAQTNDDGDVIGTSVVARFEVYAPSFGDLSAIIEEIWPAVLKQQTSEPLSETNGSKSRERRTTKKR